MKKVLLTATVQSHIAQFHEPLINMLKKNGYEVHVAAKNNLNEKNGLKIVGADKIFDIPFVRSPLSKNNIIAYKKIKNILSFNNYDIIHCNTPMGGVITRLAAKETRKKGTKVFYTAHGFHFYKGASIKSWVIYYPVEKFLSNYTDKLITITNEDYILASEKFMTSVHLSDGVGVNDGKFYPFSKNKTIQLREDLDISPSEFVILSIGELNSNKNQITTIESIRMLLQNNDSYKLLLAGNGPLEKELKEKVKEFNIENKVLFLGYRNDIVNLINLSNVVVSMSYREGLPLNIIEAMLCKKPVLCSINRGHRQLLQNFKNNELIPPNDSTQLARRIKCLYENQDLLILNGEEGFKTVNKYTEKKVYKKMKTIYELS